MEEKEIDLIQLVKRLWQKRAFILKITAVFVLLGLFTAVFSQKEYSAYCTVVPQTNKKNANSSLNTLASMAGIALGPIGSGETLSPLVYTNVMNNTSLLKELVYTPIDFEGYNSPLTLVDFYTNPDYRRFSLMGAIRKYTLGLPGVIMGLFKSDDEPLAEENALPDSKSFVTLSGKELACIKIMKSKTGITINDKEGYISLYANMPEPLAAAQVAERMVFLLQKYVTEFKIQKASSEYEFISKRYDEAWKEYSRKHEEYAKFKDANRAISSALAATKEEHIRNEYNIAYSLFSELSKQKIQSEIKVKEDTPVLTVIEPVTVPLEKSRPKRLRIIVLFTLIGGIMACGTVLGLDFLKKNFESNYLKDWK